MDNFDENNQDSQITSSFQPDDELGDSETFEQSQPTMDKFDAGTLPNNGYGYNPSGQMQSSKVREYKKSDLYIWISFGLSIFAILFYILTTYVIKHKGYTLNELCELYFTNGNVTSDGYADYLRVPLIAQICFIGFLTFQCIRSLKQKDMKKRKILRFIISYLAITFIILFLSVLFIDLYAYKISYNEKLNYYEELDNSTGGKWSWHFYDKEVLKHSYHTPLYNSYKIVFFTMLIIYLVILILQVFIFRLNLKKYEYKNTYIIKFGGKVKTPRVPRPLMLSDLIGLGSAMFSVITAIMFLFSKFAVVMKVLKLSFIDILFKSSPTSESSIQAVEYDVSNKLCIFIWLLLAVLIVSLVLHGLQLYKRYLSSNFDENKYAKYNYITALVNVGFTVLGLIIFYSTRSDFSKKINDIPGFDFTSLISMKPLVTMSIFMLISGIGMALSNIVANNLNLNKVIIYSKTPYGLGMGQYYPNQVNPMMQQMNNSDNEQTDYKELETLKEMLDKGIITQEDYDARKKKILDI